MKGIVFTEFLGFVRQHHGEEMVDDIIEACELSNGGAYTAVGTYHHGEMLALCGALSDRTGQPAAALVRAFGDHLSGTFARSHPAFFERAGNLLDFLGILEYLTVSVSPTQFNQGWAQKRLPALLEEAHYPPGSLVIELTETALVHDIDRTREMLIALRASGMRIAIDDFGVGYSNFSLLRQLPFDMLKLDRTLICDIEGDDHARALAECILELAARLNIMVVAEGVETPRQAELLAHSGCASMQGYWFARPQRELATWFAPGAVCPALPWAEC